MQYLVALITLVKDFFVLYSVNILSTLYHLLCQIFTTWS